MKFLYRKVLRHALFFLFVFAATFPLLNIMPLQYVFFVVYYLLLYYFSERRGGRMTPLLRLMEAALSVYLLFMNTLSFLSGVYFTPEIFYGTAGSVLLWLFLMMRKKVPVPRFFFLSVFFPFLCLGFIPEPWIQKSLRRDCPRIEAEARVKPVFSFCDESWVKQIKPFVPEKNLSVLRRHEAPPRAVFVAGEKDAVVAAFGRPAYRVPREYVYTLAKIKRADGRVSAAMPVSTLIHMAHSKKRGMIFATAIDENKVYAMDEKTFRLVRKIPVAVHPIYVHVDEASDTLFVVCDFGVYLYDLRSFKEKRHFVPRMAPSFSAVSRKFRKIYLCGYSTTFLVRSISLTDGTMERNRAGWIPPFSLLCSACSLDEKEGVLFTAMPMQRRMYAYRAEDLKLLYYFHVSRGIRDMDYDPETKRLYAGNYITGNLEVIDPFAQKVIEQIFVGKRIRDIFYSPVTKKAYAATALGFFEVTPD